MVSKVRAFEDSSSPKLESVLRNDPSVSMVDACYLATDPPDLVAASDAESRRDAWRSFLLRIGCRIVPAVTAKSFVLNGAQALNQLNVHARSVQVHDWVLSPEFQLLMVMTWPLFRAQRLMLIPSFVAGCVAVVVCMHSASTQNGACHGACISTVCVHVRRTVAGD